MGRHVFGAVPPPLAENNATNQGGDARIDMNHRAAGEIKNPGIPKESAAPDPMGNGRIDEDHPQAEEDQQ